MAGSFLVSRSKSTLSEVLVSILMAGSFLLSKQKRCRSKHWSVVLAASLGTELLVDADIHSIQQITEAISLLKNEGLEVRTTIFAPPRRVENTKWRQFLQTPGIIFEPVLRSNDESSEPNDDAIQRALRAFLARHDVACVALVTADKGFIELIAELQAKGTSTLVLILENYHMVHRRYRDANLKVMKLQEPNPLGGPCVRAVLASNGDGSVHLVEAYKSFDNSADGIPQVMEFLKDLGFMAGDYLVQAAKFWFANELGSLTIFPSQLATTSVRDVIRERSEDYECYPGNLAFCLPMSAVGPPIDAKGLQKYGSRLARRVYRGKGPFMLHDSPDLTSQVLRRLGYLDDHLNDDLTEALFCFLNAASNKTSLRKMGVLPGTGAESSDVCEWLHAAFLSNGSSGQWQYIKKDVTSMSDVLKHLRRAKVIAKGTYSQTEVFQAMKMHSQRCGLPAMRTFNGRALRIQQSVNRNPTRRPPVEVKR